MSDYGSVPSEIRSQQRYLQICFMIHPYIKVYYPVALLEFSSKYSEEHQKLKIDL